MRQAVTYGRLKIKENYKLLSLIKVVMVAYKWWLLARSFNNRALTEKNLVFWNLVVAQDEMVAYDRNVRLN